MLIFLLNVQRKKRLRIIYVEVMCDIWTTLELINAVENFMFFKIKISGPSLYSLSEWQLQD